MRFGKITKTTSALVLGLLLALGGVPAKSPDSTVIAEELPQVDLIYNADTNWEGTLEITESCTIAIDGITHDNNGTNTYGSAIKISGDSTVNLIIRGANTLSGNADVMSAGIEVSEGSTVNIYGEEGSSLTVTGGKYGAGIGGVGYSNPSEENSKAGTINIYRGNIKAVGGNFGAGIGSGYHQSCSEINISGGNITALGTGEGAGIGTGYGTSGGTAAAAKVGYYNAGNITITGGTIKAASYNMDFDNFDMYDPNTLYGEGYSNTLAAGIGGGYGASAGTIVIAGEAVVTAIGSCGGAGIGTGRGTTSASKYDSESSGCNINIGGNAKVVAMATRDPRESVTGDTGGAGIGLGRGWNLEGEYKGNISISGNASVYAYADGGANGIGCSVCVGKFTNAGDGKVEMPLMAGLESLTIESTATVAAISNSVDDNFVYGIGFTRAKTSSGQSGFISLDALEKFYTYRADFFTEDKFPMKIDAVDAGNADKSIAFSLVSPSDSNIMIHLPETDNYNLPIKDHQGTDGEILFLSNDTEGNSALFCKKEESFSPYELTDITASLDTESVFYSEYGELSVGFEAEKGVFEYGTSFIVASCDATETDDLYSKLDEDYNDSVSEVLFFRTVIEDINGEEYGEFGDGMTKYTVQIPAAWDTFELLALAPMDDADEDFSESQELTETDGVRYLSFEAAHAGYFAVIKLKKDPVVEAPVAVAPEFNGKSQELITAGSTSGGTMLYAVTTTDTAPGDSAYSEAIPKKTNAGTYIVWYKVVGNSDYKNTEPDHISAVIKACTHKSTEVRDAEKQNCTETGYTGDTYCLVCGKKIKTGNTIAATGHSWGTPKWSWTGTGKSVATFTCKNDSDHTKTVTADITSEVTTPETCTTKGVRTYTATVKFNGKTYTDTKTEDIAAKGHSWGTPAWTWTTDYTKATAKFTCKNDSSHTKSVAAKITSEVTTKPTCTTKGVRTYTATVTFNNKTYTAKKTASIAAKGHSWGTPKWTWTGYTKAVAAFTCKTDSSHTKKVTGTITSKVTTKATVTTAGTKTYTAKVTLNNKTYTATKTEKIYLFDKSFTGIKKYNNVLYYVKNGVQYTGFTGLAKYGNDWYYVAKGKVNLSYTGFAKKGSDWYYCEKGKANFSKKDVLKGTVNGESGWWFVSGGKVQFVDSVEKNSNGWWCIQKGKVNFNFTGIAKNSLGSWYCKGGQVQFNYSGTVNYNGKKYTIKNGKVVN